MEFNYPKGFATLSEGAKPEATSELGRSKLRTPTPQRKIDVKRELSVDSVSVFTLIRTDTTLDHSQKAEKVCKSMHFRSRRGHVFVSVTGAPIYENKMQKAYGTRRTSQAVPHPSTTRAFRRLTSEFRWDRVHSTKYGRRRKHISRSLRESTQRWKRLQNV